MRCVSITGWPRRARGGGGSPPPPAAPAPRALLPLVPLGVFLCVVFYSPGPPGSRPLPEPGDPPWFQSAVIALNCAERYGEAQVLLDAAVIEAQAAANGMILPAVLAHRAWLALRRGDLTAAEADAQALRDAPGRSPPLLYALMAAGGLVEGLVERDGLDGAVRALGPLGAGLSGMALAAGQRAP